MINDAPLFLLASERSGTNLLRKIITQHQDVYFGPSPAHFLCILYYKEPYYGDLTIDDNFKMMIKDSLDLCYVHFSPWSIELDIENILQRYNDEKFPKRNSIFLSHLLMTIYARYQGYKTYFCKDNNLYDFVFEILHCIPNAKFIYLHRDPRDFSVSQYKRSLQTDSLIRISNLWAYEQVKCISAFSSLDSEDIIKVSYEDILKNSKNEIRRICKFLKVNFIEDEKEVEVFTGKSEEWSNLDKPIIKNNTKKYLKVFSKKQILIIESITEEQMKYLGYNLEYKPKKIKVLNKIFEIFWGELKFRIRRYFIKNDDKHLANIERSKLINRLAVKWNRSI
ncbi:sulfotransferase [Halarcobacter sp.]|uniref:sulfotransferase family protein n=1 Tax=Halarcobacter sp. TaxID=2321133 RepID=UPI002AAAADE3|nr:sulfotransferase [Halarcobacter sp.]